MRRDEPNDLYLTDEERKRIFHDYIRSTPGAADRFRANPGLLAAVSGMSRIVRQRYSGWHEGVEAKVEQAKIEAEPTGIPESVAQRLKSPGLFYGPTQKQALAWAKGPSGPQATMRHLGLFIYGPTWGKTIAACMTISPAHVKVGRGKRAFVSEANLLKAMATRPSQQNPNPLLPFENVMRLVVDHMGALEPGKKTTREVIEFLRGRWERGLTNVLTTRKTVPEFQDHYGADAWATVERFCTMCEAKKANQA